MQPMKGQEHVEEKRKGECKAEPELSAQIGHGLQAVRLQGVVLCGSLIRTGSNFVTEVVDRVDRGIDLFWADLYKVTSPVAKSTNTS